ncbi:putative bifunctional diguanylate cyclase/phosphodiesterase [Pseudoduganella umbonata]|uniref:Diguanylate cyclase (GGDEF)-like protein/PAS domain S-box-containing protein n=1 Tax=Pseudoduganella umbonata TaxID=864828 RepID=A0A4P8HTR0_9BURK|nr:EAL domain-containing protein [Pseudoduganella umbonata]MBB3220366.1 diguanylate cyclase (GGDEF)-like protein/PAS domain S-box-containing protein [Pseudoduganella umbonata]QCP12098.1 EAL domain-containing protein [Pseudoduganella umbonata]
MNVNDDLGQGGAAASLPRLLLVDDEPRLLSSLYELLRDRDYRLVTAASGSEALVHLDAMRFDLVLLDLRLPDIGGHEIMDVINGRGYDCDVIVMSGEVGIDAAIGALKRGAYDYLRKPYSREELLKTVENALQKRRLAGDNQRIAQRLETSEKMYRYLVDSSPDIIYTLDHEGRFTFVNDRAYQLLGFTREELIGRHYSFVVHDEDLDRARYVFNERRVDERASRNVELRLKCNTAHGAANGERTFTNTLMTISLNAIGMHVPDGSAKKREFFGTYGVARDITDRKRAEEMISYQAYHDILTDLPNRMLFKDRLGLAVIQAKRKLTELAVMFIDLDRFKLVNDTLGHVKGDELLQQAAARLKACLRRGDTLARQGGDEFTIVLPELRDRNDAKAVAEKFLDALQKPFDLDGHVVHISASIGIAVYPGDGETIDELLRHADIAMYQVKALGKNGHSFYHASMLDMSHQKIALEQALRRALENGELEMYYQPQVDVITGRIVGAEGLMRWNHPERGLLSAGEFLPFAEENGLMLPLSDWMLGALCRDLLVWNAAGGDTLRLSLNLSPQYLDRGDFFEKMRGALSRYGISPAQIEVEITENICIRNPQYAIDQLNKLCQLGVSVAIDDFGTGYSSLAYLHRFPIHTIKIDQSFVKEIHDEGGHYPVILAIISIARGLGLHLVAEGVETDAQARYLQANGCTTMQGYLYYRPVSLATFVDVLKARDPLPEQDTLPLALRA